MSDLLWSLLVSLAVSVVWSVVGVMNIESGLHILYSLGSSAGWHDWLTRGAPGEVVRHWGVPVYDQWSGLGYRLPTQGLLTDTPLSYLALFLPVNAIVFVAWCGSLWFLFHQVHRWIGQWVSRHRLVFCVFVDTVLIGVMSFYTLWHGWQTVAIQVSGAMVCFVVLTDRALLSESEDVDVFGLSSKLSGAALMLLMPHLGYGLTFVPAVVVVAAVVLVSRRAELSRWCRTCPQLVVPPMLAALVVTPGVLDFLRESQLQDSLPGYSPELGVLDFMVRAGLSLESPQAWLRGLILFAHTFVFPLLGLIDPSAYQEVAPPLNLARSWNGSPWPFTIIQFHGGLLFFVLSVWTFRTRTEGHKSRAARAVAVMGIIAMLIALLNSRGDPLPGLALDWVPFLLLSNSRWLYADLAIVITLVLLVVYGERVVGTLTRVGTPRNRGAFVTRPLLIAGLLIAAFLLPYRMVEPLRINGGQTRFAPLQIDARVRGENEEWRLRLQRLQSDLLGSNSPSPQRVFMEGEGFTGAEGDNVWWGLRTHSQLRDVRLSSLLSWPRMRNGATLVKSDKLQHIVSDPLCHLGLQRALDVLAVSWSVLPSTCVREEFVDLTPIKLEMPPSWTNVISTRPRESIMKQMTAISSSVDYSAVSMRHYHHWWISEVGHDNSVCSFLVDDCVTHLRLIKGKTLDLPPLEICESRCVATYDLSEGAPSGALLVIPLNYDSTLRAESGGRRLRSVNRAGLLAVDTSKLHEASITVSVQPDLIMRLRGLSPIASVVLMLLALFSGSCRQRSIPAESALTTD